MTEPALTADEWAEYTGPHTHGRLIRDCDLCFGQLSYHERAALCLHEQPFGFSQQDLVWLRQMSFSSLSREDAESHQAWWQSFLTRIIALLPPSQ